MKRQFKALIEASDLLDLAILNFVSSWEVRPAVLRRAVLRVCKQNATQARRGDERACNFLVERVLAEFGGKADSLAIRKLVNEELEQWHTDMLR